MNVLNADKERQSARDPVTGKTVRFDDMLYNRQLKAACASQAGRWGWRCEWKARGRIQDYLLSESCPKNSFVLHYLSPFHGESIGIYKHQRKAGTVLFIGND